MKRQEADPHSSYNYIVLVGFMLITIFIYFNQRPGKPSEATGTTGAVGD